MATGSINVMVTGGSGNYNYQVKGTLATPFTSSNTITGLKPGTYSIIVKDINTNCTVQKDSVVILGAYNDPRFQLNKTDVTCNSNDGSITLSNLNNGLSPFVFSIIAPSPSNVGTSNATGNFFNLSPGEYFIQLQDSCGGQQVRRITIQDFSWWFDSYLVSKIGCDSADAVINLKDSKGNINTTGTSFSGYTYGLVKAAGDTAWYPVNAFRFYLGSKRSVSLVAKDNCGKVHSAVWNMPASQQASVGPVSISNYACSTFTASISGQQNLVSPQYCLYNDANVLVNCNTTGVFNNINYGNYCIKVADNCYDTTITRCFTAVHPVVSVGPAVAISNRSCSTYTATITGQTNTTNPQYCLYNSSNVLVGCNNTGIFDNVPFGSTHTIKIKDGCVDTTITRTVIDSRVMPSLGGSIISNKTCTTFDVAATGSTNLAGPTYFLFDSTGSIIKTNATGIFLGLLHGKYCIKAINSCGDSTSSVCFTSKPLIPSITAPVSFTNISCSTFTVTIGGGVNLTNPQYCIYDSVTAKNICNTTGIFPNMQFGSYCATIKDGCADTTLVRCFTLEKPLPTLSGSAISNRNCTTFDVKTTGGANLINPTYCLYTAGGVADTCNTTGIFINIPHGNYCIKAVTSCGDTTNTICFSSVAPTVSVGSTVSVSNQACSTFTATITGQTNTTNPQYCLYNNVDSLIQCNGTGVFAGIPYGSYCIKIKDGCVDTTLTRCFSLTAVMPSVNSTIQKLNVACSTFTAKITGNNLTNPVYKIYNSGDVLLQTNSTGIFDNLPYGTYCATVQDGCKDTTFRICQTFSNPKTMAITTSKPCSIGFASIGVNFGNATAPFIINVYHPNGSSVYNTTTSNVNTSIVLPFLPAGQSYKVVGTDNCGYKDSSLIVPDATILSKSILPNGKCPSATWQNGSGDLSITCSSNLYPVIPAIIKKNGMSFNRGYSSNTGTNYSFSDLEPATYIVSYTMQSCNTVVYDTFALQPYAYPTQERSAIYQCDNNSFSLGAAVTGGVGPFTYQIIGSMPESPSIQAVQNNNPIFSINNGTTYSLIRLRTIDGCGNATLNDVSVLPIQNIIIRATSTCMYKNVVLSVDSIPNAAYHWYKKLSDTDSTLVGDSARFDIPFLMPEQTGIYICKVTVNNECITRLSTFDLTGNCDYQYLPISISLSGEKGKGTNKLSWNVRDEEMAKNYVVERKAAGERTYTSIGKVSPRHISGSRAYEFIDRSPTSGAAIYRIKVEGAGSKVAYSNVINLKGESFGITVFPNPVKNAWSVSLSSPETSNYRLALTNMAGQLVFQKELKGVMNDTFRFQRSAQLKSGMYLLKVENTSTGTKEVFKLLLE